MSVTVGEKEVLAEACGHVSNKVIFAFIKVRAIPWGGSVKTVGGEVDDSLNEITCVSCKIAPFICRYLLND